MFACLCLVSSSSRVDYPVEALLELASDFSPRYEMVRPHLVVVEIGGLGRLLGTPREIGEAFCRVARDRGMLVTVGIAATHTAALLLALHLADGASVSLGDAANAAISTSVDRLASATIDPHGRSPADPSGNRLVGPHDVDRLRGDAGLMVVPLGREASALAPLPLSLLAVLPGDRLSNDDVAYLRRRSGPESRESHADAPGARPASPRGKTRGWRGRGYSQHYRLAPAPLPPDEPSCAALVSERDLASSTEAVRSASEARSTQRERGAAVSGPATATSGPVVWEHAVHPASAVDPSLDERRDAILDVLRHWGLKTLGELARLPAADIFTRLGRDGLALQQIARGQDTRPLVPTTADKPFEATLTLDWPIDALEPLSFVLTRLFEPLCARLERCDRGAAVLQVTLQLVTRRSHVRRLELPAPMRDPKVLRTLVLLDLESHPPDAGIDRLTITIDPTPGRVVQHSLLMRALPSPEQLSTLTARLAAVMGEGRVGAPALLDTYRPEAFEMRRFEVDDGPRHAAKRRRAHAEGAGAPHAAAVDLPARFVLRRFRRPIPARVRVEEGRPVHVTPQGLPGGHVVQAAGPWRTSGEWWKSPSRLQPLTAPPVAAAVLARPALQNPAAESWDRDEWDVALSDGTLYRIHLDHREDRWFAEAQLD